MPDSIKQIRDARGGLDNLTDEQIVKIGYDQHKNYYGSEDEYAKAIGYGGAGRGLTMSRLSAGVDSYQGQLYGAAESLARSAGMDGVADAAGRGRKTNKDAADYANARAKEQGGIDDFRDVRGIPSALNFAGGLAAQSAAPMLAQLTGGVIGGLVGGPAGAIAGGAAVGYGNAFADISDNQREQTENQPGGPRTDSLSAALYAAPYAAVDAFTGVGGMLTRGLSRVAGAVQKPVAKEGINFLERGLNNLVDTKGVAARVAYSGAKTGLVEGAGETFQELMNQGGRMAVDPNATLLGDDAQKRYVDSFVGGGVLGGLLGGAGNRGRRYGLQPAAAAPAPADGFSPDTSQGFEDLLKPRTETLGPLGDLTPEFTTSRGFEDLQRRGGIDASGLYPAVGEAPLVPQGLGLVPTANRSTQTEIPGLDMLPDVMGVDFKGTVAGSDAENNLMNDPGAVEARRQQMEQQQRAQAEAQAARDREAVFAKRRSDAHSGLLDTNQDGSFPVALKPREIATFSDITGLYNAGLLNSDQRADMVGALREALKADDKATLSSVSKEVELLKNPPKAPDATPATAATAQTTAQTDAAPKAPAGPVATVAPASGDNLSAAQPKPAAAPAVKKATPVERAAKILDKLKKPHGEPVKVTRRVKGKDTTVEISALDNWTQLVSNPQVAGRSLKALGIDAEGNQVASPMSFAEIGKQETPPVSREAVRKQLARYGINETAINAAVATPDSLDARSGAAFEEAEDSTGIVAVPKESDITATDGEILPQPTRGDKGTFGRREEDTLSKAAGAGLVRGEKETSAEQAARVQGDNLIRQANRGGADETSTADKTEAETRRKDQAAKQAKQDQQNRDRADAEVAREHSKILASDLAGNTEADWDDTKSESTPAFAALTPGQKIQLVYAYKDAVDSAQGDWPSIEAAIKTFEGELNSENLRQQSDARAAGSSDNPGASSRDGSGPAVTGELAQGEQGNSGPQGRADASAGRTVEPTTGVKPTADLREPTRVEKDSHGAEATLDHGEHSYMFDPSNGVYIGRRGTNEASLVVNHTDNRRNVLGPKSPTPFPASIPEALRPALLQYAKAASSQNASEMADARDAVAHVVDALNAPATQRSDAPNSRGVSDAKQLTSEFSKFLRVGVLGRLVTVVQSVGDLPFAPGVAQSVGVNARTQGFVMGGKSYFVADNIAPGKGKAVFMHEVGAHLGLQQLLTQGEFKNLVNTVSGWTSGKAGPAAQKIARAAMARVQAAKTSAAQYNTELVAYAVEEATLAGYNPAAAGNEGPIKAWMRSVVQQVKNLLTKLGVNPDKFGVQDLVDLAYGAARAVHSMDVQETSGNPQFSQAINTSHAAVQSAFKDAWATAGGLGSSFLKKAAFTSDLVNMAANNGLNTAHAYLKAMNAVQTEKVKLVQEVQDVVEEFGKLTPDERGQGLLSVNIYLRDSTMDKAWGHVPTWKPTAKTNAAMAARYNALSPRAQALVDRVFKHGDNVRTHLKNAADATVRREFAETIAAAEKAGRPEQVVQLKAEQAQALKDSGKGLDGDWPYTPLGRFGNHVVLAMSSRYLQAVKDGNKKLIDELQTDAKHYQVERTDTMRSARVLAESLQTNFPGGHVTSFERGPENSLVYGGRDALGALTRLRHLVKESASDDLKLDAQANSAIDKSLRDLHLQLLSETSARKSGLGRANIAGANKDMMRTFAGQGQAMAHYIATLRMGADVQDSLQAMKDQAEERTSGDTQRRAYYNELLKRHVLNLEYSPNKAVEMGMAASSIWTLLTNPAHHITNGLQTVMSTLPQMAGKHGYAKSAAALKTAYYDLGPLIKGGSFKEMDFTKLPKDVQAMAKALADRGSIGVDQGLELGQFDSAPDSKLHVFTTVVEKLRGMAEGVEAVNRLSAAMAAYRLEIKNGASEQAATEYAHKTVLETHGDYSGFNAPRVMRSGFGRLLTQFKKYQLIQLSLYSKLGHQAFNGASPEERAVAYKTIGFNLAHLAAIGGMTGLPGFALVAWMMGKIFGDKDKPEDNEAKLRRMIGDKHLADLLLHGAPKFAGMDLSTRLGLGDVLTPLPYSEPGLSRKGYESILIGLSGPLLGGLLPRFADGLGQMSKSIETGKGEDFFKGLEQLVPNGVGNVMKGMRYQANGLTQRNGDTVIQPEDMSVLASFSQALGLPSNTITDKNYLAGQMRTSSEFYKQRSSAIKQAYVNAQEGNDADGMKESRAEWMRMQGALREQGYTTQPLSVLLKAPSEKRKREGSAVSGVETNKRNRGAVEMLTE